MIHEDTIAIFYLALIVFGILALLGLVKKCWYDNQRVSSQEIKSRDFIVSHMNVTKVVLKTTIDDRVLTDAPTNLQHDEKLCWLDLKETSVSKSKRVKLKDVGLPEDSALRKIILNTETICDICLGEFKDGDNISSSHNMNCEHHFHKDCIIEWLIRHDTCPCCRRKYLTNTNNNEIDPRQEQTASDNIGSILETR
mmetsp:Transcript_8307/g.10237  ORF Transcript_8307/g.10237 Transcript_8307/m.10237 type:complete len:196 (-) Transcript_8307:82-669(-)